jgi:hypothetical protein
MEEEDINKEEGWNCTCSMSDILLNSRSMEEG